MIHQASKFIISAFLLLIFSHGISALEAPYLISATPLSDTSVSLAWRNNDAATQGFIIQRCDSTEAEFATIDSVRSSIQLEYTDVKGLKPVTNYRYRIIAYNATEVSDTSNNLSITTLPHTVLLEKPSVSLSWEPDISKDVLVTISDYTSGETGYRLFRADGENDPYRLVAQFIGASPGNRGEIEWHDTTISLNKWYKYRALVYYSNDSLFSDSCMILTFCAIPLSPAILFEKICEFPVAGSNGWSAIVGDSLYLKESVSPADKFTIINVKDPANPKFDGYIDSSVLESYPMETMIPIYLKTGVFNKYKAIHVTKYKDLVLATQKDKDHAMYLYKIEGDTLIIINGTSVMIGTQYIPFGTNFYRSDDSTVAISYYRPRASGDYKCCTIFQLTTDGFHSKGTTEFERDTGYFTVHGFFESMLLLSTTNDTSGRYNIFAKDMQSNRTYKFIHTGPIADVYNTGVALAPHIALYTNGPEFFAAHVADYKGYETAKNDSAVYLDSAHLDDPLQNVLADTISRKVYLIYSNTLSILNYYPEYSRISNRPMSSTSSIGKYAIITRRNGADITIILPSNSRHADLCFYDLNGRVIEKFMGIKSNAVSWKPRSRGCFIAMLKSGKNVLTERIVVK